MEIILLEHIKKLGKLGDVVKVKDGYARNFLIPNKKALRANSENLDFFKKEKEKLELDNQELKSKAEKKAKAIDNKSITLIRQASETGQLYGSVNSRDIAKELSDDKNIFEHKHIQLDIVIKEVGVHVVKVVLHPEVEVNIKVNVARSQEEASNQEKSKSLSKNDKTITVDNIFDKKEDLEEFINSENEKTDSNDRLESKSSNEVITKPVSIDNKKESDGSKETLEDNLKTD